LPQPLVITAAYNQWCYTRTPPQVTFSFVSVPPGATGATVGPVSYMNGLFYTNVIYSAPVTLGSIPGTYVVQASCFLSDPTLGLNLACSNRLQFTFTAIASCQVTGTGTSPPTAPGAQVIGTVKVFGSDAYISADGTVQPKSMTAIFVPEISVPDAADLCHFVGGFNWQQTVNVLPSPTNPSLCFVSPSPCAEANSDPLLVLTAPPAFPDPPDGGYTNQPTGYDPYPFAYYQSDPIPKFNGDGTVHIEDPYAVNFRDTPEFPLLPPGKVMQFTTSLVGVLDDNTPGPVLYSWTWESNFTGASGGVSYLDNLLPPDPGSGTGGVTITSINGVLLPPVVPPSQVVTTASGLAYSRVSQTFNGTVTVKNIGSGAITGPLQIVFFGMPVGVTLANATGNLSGTPYLTTPAVAGVAPGHSATVSVQFKNPTNATINFEPVIYSGSF